MEMTRKVELFEEVGHFEVNIEIDDFEEGQYVADFGCGSLNASLNEANLNKLIRVLNRAKRERKELLKNADD